MTTLGNALMRYGLGGLAALLVLAMMSVTSIDVLGRYVFNRPLTGAFEITELLLAALIFLGLPITTQREEHITVDLLDSLLPHCLHRVQMVVTHWLSALVLLLIASRLWVKAQSLAADGHITNTLEIPLAPIAYLMASMCLLSAIVLIVKGLHGFKPRDTAE